MKTLRGNIPLKLLCILLCCLFLGGGAATMTNLLFEVEDGMDSFGVYTGTIYGGDYLGASYTAGNYREAALNRYRLSQKKTLNDNEKRQLEQAEELLNSQKTNFRYELTTLEGKRIQSNIETNVTLSRICGKRYAMGIIYDLENDEYTYYRNEMIRSTDQTLNELLNQFYTYDVETGKYYEWESSYYYREELENWEANQREASALAEEATADRGPLCIRKDESTLLVWIAEEQRFVEVPITFTNDNRMWYENPIVGTQDSDDGIKYPVPYYQDIGGQFYTYDPNAEEYIPTDSGAVVDSFDGPDDTPEPDYMIDEQPRDTRKELVAMMEWGLLDELPIHDAFYQVRAQHDILMQRLPFYLAILGSCAVMWLLSLVWLLVSCGHKDGVEGAYLAPGHKCPADLLTALEVSVFVAGAWFWLELLRAICTTNHLEDSSRIIYANLLTGGAFAVGMLVLLPLLTTITAQLKTRQLLRRTVCFQVLRLCWSILRSVVRGCVGFCAAVFRNINAVWKIGLLYCVVVGGSCFCMVIGLWDSFFIFLVGLILAAAGFVLTMRWAIGWRKAELAAQTIAAGDLYHQTDPAGTPGDIRRHIENLNSISGGIQKAVAEQMKSDRFRTELITNVSHDLKTPLTSIISYVDLLKKLDIQDKQAAEYIDVLERKSQRLKTLTEDLVEASKAATGVLPVTLERLNAGMMIHQAVGEYEERLDKAGLKVVTQIPNDAVYISADGRHLWRILDNLLNNCVKYAMPDTRVYLSLTRGPGTATISVKNISSEPLNVPPEELIERFVRGDSSRTNEGSGLGLSIAQSLAALQGAQFSVDVDGDLFKAQITFNMVK